MFGDKTIAAASRKLEDQLKTELADQGHHLTGALEDSVQARQESNGDATAVDIYANDYINPVNEGVPAEKIPFDSSKQTGAESSKYIEGLKNYAKLRFGITNEREALGAAFAIAKKHEQEGMPTKGSFAFSSNGRRTEALQQSFESDRKVDQFIEQGLSDELDDFLDVKEDTIII